MKLKLFRKTDFIIIVAVLLCSVVALIWLRSGTKSGLAVISVDGQTVETINLSAVTKRREYNVGGEYNILIVAENGKIRFEHSDCHDKLCVKCGELYRKGDTAVCLPAKTVVTVTGDGLDAVTY